MAFRGRGLQQMHLEPLAPQAGAAGLLKFQPKGSGQAQGRQRFQHHRLGQAQVKQGRQQHVSSHPRGQV